MQREKCLSDGIAGKSRTLITTDFETLQITIKNLQTVISLLKCEESEVVVSTLTALSNFIAKSVENIAVLFDNHALDDLMPLVEHEDLVTRRLATKLLAQMTSLDIIQNYLTNASEKNYLHCFMNILHDDADVFMQEYLLTIISSCCDDIFGASKILESLHLDTLLKTIQSIDPGVRKNSLEILNKLMIMPAAAEIIFHQEEFDFTKFYSLLHDEYESIQKLALSSLEYFLMRNRDDEMQRTFRDSGGLQKLLELVHNDNLKDLHSMALKLLVLATDNGKTSEYLASILSSEGVSEILRASEDSADPIIFQLMANLAATPEFRKVLYDSEIISLILKHLEVELDSELLNPICSLIGHICHLTSASNEFLKANIIIRLIEILGNGEYDWRHKENVLFAINELLSRELRNGGKIIDTDGHMFLLALSKNRGIPMHVRLGSLKTISILLKVPRFRNFFMDRAVIEILSNSFEDETLDELKIASCSISTFLFIEEEARQLCLETNFLEKLCNLISNEESLPVQLSALELIQQLCNDEILIQEIIKIKFLNVLLERRDTMRHVLPSWETCLQTILSGHLPLKFAITGCLSLHDITKNGFYATKRHVHPLPPLDQLLKCRSSPIECLYVANFSISPVPDTDENHSSICSTEALEDSSGEEANAVETSRMFHEEFTRLKPDPKLCESLRIFQRILRASEAIDRHLIDSPTIMDVSKIESRAKLLAKFVAQKLSTPSPQLEDHCVKHQLDYHLQELHENLETSVIPLGELRVGSYFERALLFKVIADRICLPAALIRGEYGKSRIEIACPELHRSSRNFLPTRLLHPNYIVDLMDTPGELLPIDSHSARKYFEYESICSKQCTQNTENYFK